MKSITYGEVTDDRMLDIIKEYINEYPECEYEVTIGTDSQNFHITRTVIVVAIHRVGHGGIFFYDVKHVNKITNLKQKIWFETSESINLAINLAEKLIDEDILYNIVVHVDVGHKGDTSKVIPEITAYVEACGFDCKIKPDSYTASVIANKYTKVKKCNRKRLPKVNV